MGRDREGIGMGMGMGMGTGSRERRRTGRGYCMLGWKAFNRNPQIELERGGIESKVAFFFLWEEGKREIWEV